MQNVVNLRSLVARLHESFNDRDLDAWSDVFGDEVEFVVDGGAFRGVAAARAYVTAVFREFPGLRIHGARVVAESGDTIVVEHQILNGDPSRGPLRPQGSVCEIYRVRDGRVVAYRSYYAAEGADREDVVRVPSRAEGSKMAEEQAALRRVATLVARGVLQDELFAAVNEEIGWLVGADPTSLMRFEADDTVTLVAAWSAADADFPIGARRPVDDELRSLRDGGRAVRFGPMELPLDGPFVEEVRQLAIRSAVGVPIVVDGRVWGVAFAASTREEPFPEDTETRLAQFTELLATAISNTEARADASRLAEEQAALRRVATLVAHESSPSEVSAAVAKEVAGLLGVENMRMVRYEADATVTVVAEWGEPDAAFPVGSRLPLGGRTSPRRCLEQSGPPASSTRRPPEQSGPTRAGWEAAPRSALRSWSTDDSGESWSRRRRRPGRCGRTPSRAWRTSPSWSRRRSRTPKRGRRWRRPVRGSWRRPTRSAAGWFAICTTARSSGWSTRSSR